MKHGRATPKVGEPAPELELPTGSSEQPFSLTRLRGQPVLVSFLSHAA